MIAVSNCRSRGVAATPLVTGAAVALIQNNPSLTPDQVKAVAGLAYPGNDVLVVLVHQQKLSLAQLAGFLPKAVQTRQGKSA